MLELLATTALVFTFLIASLGKLASPDLFSNQLYNLRFPTWAIVPIGIFLPILELIITFLLAFNGYFAAGPILATILLAAFSIVVTYLRVRGSNFECGCFGNLVSPKISWVTVGRDYVLLSLALLLLFLHVKPGGSAVVRSGLNVETQTFIFTIGIIVSWLIWLTLGREARPSTSTLLRGDDSTSNPSPIYIGKSPARIGDILPDIIVATSSQGRVLLSTTTPSSSQLLLIILSTGCRSCQVVEERVRELWSRQPNPITNVVLLRQDDDSRKNLQLSTTPVDHNLHESLDLRVFPTALMLRGNEITSTPISGDGRILKLLPK